MLVQMKHYILHFPISILLLHPTESSRRIQCKQCSRLLKLLPILHYCFCCLLYILLQIINFISFFCVLADKPVIPDRHSKPKTYNLKPQAVKLHSNSCCTDNNNFTKLIKIQHYIDKHKILKISRSSIQSQIYCIRRTDLFKPRIALFLT